MATTSPAAAQGRKVIVDQDARGPASTDMQSILLFLQAPDVQVLGITLVCGDQWIKEQTQRTLRAVEIAGRTDVPVVPGAEVPLINSKEESEIWERQWGEFAFKGAWTPRLYHPPDVVPELREGNPSIAASEEHAANFIVRMVRQYPNEVTIWAGGPLTNIALALRLDPEVATLAKELVLMGAGFNVGQGGIHRINGRREFNWWFDPEAVRIAMSAPWKKITITPVDISVKTRLSDDIKAEIAKVRAPVAEYHTKFAGSSFMWDEISALAWMDPSIITKQQELYVNIDIDHGPSYGQTIFVEKETKGLPVWWRTATVQWDLDTAKFYRMYIDLMSRAPGRLKPAPTSARLPAAVGAGFPGPSAVEGSRPSANVARGASSRRKVFIDQDAAGPAGTDMLSTLALLQSPDVEVLGIAVTSGDVWMRAGVRNMLRMVELTGHGAVPVAPGGEFPLINTREETEIWEDQFGEFVYKGAWNPARWHEPHVVPPYTPGEPAIAPAATHGANLLVETIRKHPGEVTVWVGGPLTTVALALRLDPEIAAAAKELVLMGAGFNVDRGGNHRINGRREFNWWWDPEAARIAMSAPWKKITITPVDISVKTSLSDEIKGRIAQSKSRAAQYVTKFAPRGAGGGDGSFMWDEIAAVAFLDPTLITKQQDLYVNIDIDHGAGYGQTIFVETEMEAPRGQKPAQRTMPSWWRVATVQWDLDTKRFYDAFVQLMSR
jgi:purine nucleosidase